MARSSPLSRFLILILVAAASVSAQEPPPAAAASGNTSSSNANANETVITLAQPLPESFFAVRSCVPFTVLVVPGGNSSTSGPAVSFAAAPAVINATNATIAEGVLAIQLAHAFEAARAIQLTITTDPARPLTHAAAYGSGDVVLAPGVVNASELAVGGAAGGGRVIALGVDVDALSVRSAGVAGHYVEGSFRAAAVEASGITTTALATRVPANISVDVSGISTVAIDGADGTSIAGTADGLSRVLYSNGSCSVRSRLSIGLRFPSIFGAAPFGAGGGGGGGLFDTDKCTRLSADDMKPHTAAPPLRWSCGLVVDGATVCVAPNATNVTQVEWNLPAGGAGAGGGAGAAPNATEPIPPAAGASPAPEQPQQPAEPAATPLRRRHARRRVHQASSFASSTNGQTVTQQTVNGQTTTQIGGSPAPPGSVPPMQMPSFSMPEMRPLVFQPPPAFDFPPLREPPAARAAPGAAFASSAQAPPPPGGGGEGGGTQTSRAAAAGGGPGDRSVAVASTRCDAPETELAIALPASAGGGGAPAQPAPAPEASPAPAAGAQP